MEFNSVSAPFPFHYGLSAVPIDGQTFQLVQVTSPPALATASFVENVDVQDEEANSSQSIHVAGSQYQLFSDPFLSMLASSPDLSGVGHLSSPSVNIQSSFPSASLSTIGSFNESPITEDRPLPDLFNPSMCQNGSSGFEGCVFPPVSNAASDNPLANIPYFSVLCQVLDTDLKFQKVTTGQQAVCRSIIQSMENDLYEKMQLLKEYHPRQVSSLRSFYKEHSSNIEVERFQTVSKNGMDNYYALLLNNHFDEQLVQIINRVNKSLDGLKQSVQSSCQTSSFDVLRAIAGRHEESVSSFTSSTPSKSVPHFDTFLSTDTTASYLHKQDVCPASTTGSHDLIYASTSPSPMSAMPMPSLYMVSSSTSRSPFPSNISPIVRSRAVLSKGAIRIMETWYSYHAEHPYPNATVTAELAEAGRITHGQVRKWFANKRSRSKNTKTLSAIACRKRFEKIGHLFP